MPTGYQVTLGPDQTLTLDDDITDSWTTFTTDTYLGPGEWVWTGTYLGTEYYNELEPGDYYLGTDGNVYFVPDYGEVSTLADAEPVTYPDYSELNIVDGTSGNDNINNPYVDSDGEGINDTSDNADYVKAYSGDDTISAQSGADTVFGGSGNDSIRGGNDDDVLHGDGQTGSTEALHWYSEGTDGTNLSSGFTQNTGDMDVTVSFADDGNNNPAFRVETSDQIYTTGSDPHDDHSSLYMYGNGGGATATATIDFAAAARSDVTDEVENVTFRINDIDWASGNHRDIVTVNAYDANGDPVAVTLTVTATGSGQDSVSGNTITAGDMSDSQSDDTGSVLVEIDGPVQSIEIIYSNGLSGTQAIWVSDVYFDTIPNDDGNDTLQGDNGNDTLFGEGGNDSLSGGNNDDSLDGGDGDDTLVGGNNNDTLLGGAGNDSLIGGSGTDSVDAGDGDDTVEVGQGDTVSGGAGDDVFRLVDLAEAGTSAITLVGGEDDETDGDTLDLSNVGDRGKIDYTTKTTGEMAGTVQLIDGTVLTFSNIEHVICFTPGTMIRTPHGDRRIETLRPGDLVLTQDNGPQPVLWIGGRTVPAEDDLAPICLDPALFAGAEAPLLVSPQHRMLWTGSRAQLLFGSSEVLVPARHLIRNGLAHRQEGGTVTYLHLMLPQHDIIYANGVAAESFFPGDEAFCALTPMAREELFEIMPELRSHPGAFSQTARPCLKSHEAAVLVA